MEQPHRQLAERGSMSENIKSHRTKDCLCLSCGKALNSAITIDGESAPIPGDIAICLDCGHIMVFDENLAARELTDEEVIETAGSPDLILMQKLRKMFEEDNKHSEGRDA